jgi:hypothetical protein
MLDRCDQIVASTTGTVPRMATQTIVALWGDAGPPPDGGHFALHRVTDDVTTMLELAVVTASGWVDLDAATPVPLGL